MLWYKNLIKHLKRNNYFPNNNLLFLSLFLFILFLVVEVTLRIWDLYRHIPMVDIPSHFFAGMAIACLTYWVYSLTPDPPHLSDFFFWDGIGDTIVAIVGGLVLLYLVFPFLKKKTSFFKKINI
jgi:hypothetical protein